VTAARRFAGYCDGMRTTDEWKALLRTALRDAMRARDADAVAVLREVLAAIDNAEAADPSVAPPASSEVIAGAVDGLGAGEVARVVLGPADIAAVIARELAERQQACEHYMSLDRHDDAQRLRRQIALVESFV